MLVVLLNAFGLSFRKTSGFLRILSEPVSKSSVEEWARRVEEKLGFESKPHEYPIIAVDAYTRQPIRFGVSLTRANNPNALRFLRRLRKRCLGG